MFELGANEEIRSGAPRFHGEVEKQEDHFLWKIHGFEGSVKPRDSNFSPYFEFVGRTWGLQICSLGSHIRLILKNYSDSDSSDCVTLGLKVEDKFMMRNAKPDVSGRVFTVSKFMSCTELFLLNNPQILQDGTLTIYCKIASRERNLEEEEKQQRELESFEDLRYDIEGLLEQSYFRDVCFLVQRSFIDAHRNILSARSAVLADMVSHHSDVKDPVRIPDVDPGTFRDFLYYLYTGNFRKMNSRVAARLLPLAERYQVPELKDECELFLKRYTTKEPIWVDIPTPDNENLVSADPPPRRVPYRKRKNTT